MTEYINKLIMINMTIKNVLNAYKYISSLKLNKLDKEIRVKLIKNYPILDKVVKEYDDYRKSLQDKMFEDYTDDIDKVQILRSQLTQAKTQDEVENIIMESQKYQTYLKLEQDFINIVDDKLKEEVDLKFFPMDREEFVENLIKLEIDFTLEDLQKIDILFQ